MDELTPEEFILARLHDTQSAFERAELHGFDRSMVVSFYKMLAFYRSVLEWHKSWPVLVEGPMEYEGPKFDDFESSANSLTMSLSKQMAYLTTQEYIKRFGTLPPTAPLIKQMLMQWVDHPDFKVEWVR